MKHYSFKCYDEEENTTTIVEFSTESARWLGCDGPMMKFFDFLRGCGFMFDLDTNIGVMLPNGEFRNADDFDCGSVV